MADTSIISEDEALVLIKQLLERRAKTAKPSITEDDIRYYLHLETMVRLDQAQMRLLEQGRMTAEWDEDKQDWMVRLA